MYLHTYHATEYFCLELVSKIISSNTVQAPVSYCQMYEQFIYVNLVVHRDRTKHRMTITLLQEIHISAVEASHNSLSAVTNLQPHVVKFKHID